MCAGRNTPVRKLQKWFNEFQRKVDWVTKGIIEFTMEIWKPIDEKKRKVNEMRTVLGGNSTSYLDADLFFNDKGEFGTRVYFKKRYKIKYVGANSVHPDSCKKSYQEKLVHQNCGINFEKARKRRIKFVKLIYRSRQRFERSRAT